MRAASPRTTSSPSPALAAAAADADADADAAPAGADSSNIAAAEATLVRVHVIPRPDDSGVQLQILPSVLCLFGSVPFPAPSASSLDFAAALLLQAGGRSEVVSCAGATALTPAASAGGAGEEVYAGASPAPGLRSAVPAHSEGGASAVSEDPAVQKDQSSKARRGAAGKAATAGASDKQATLDPRKSQAAFPGSLLLKRIFSGFGNSSNSGNVSDAAASPPPASVQELGAELLAACGCGAADTQLTAAAAASTTMVAGYVQAASAPVRLAPAGEGSAASASSVPPSPGGDIAFGADDAAAAEAEAAAAVHRMSTDIFRNVLRASGGGGGDVSSPGKAQRSPRDTAFLSSAAATKAAATASPRQRDQAPTAAFAADTGAAADSINSKMPTRASATAIGASAAEGSPCKDEQSAPGVAAMALLAGLAAPPAAAAQPPAAIRTGGGLAAAGSLEMLAPGQSGEMSEGGGLPMPDLEKCESPVMAKAAAGSGKVPGGSPPPRPGVPLATAASEEVVAEEEEEVTLSVAPEQEAEPVPEPVAAVQAAVVPPVPTAAAEAVAEAGATASPRTVSKKAYGTVANIVRKMVPGFRDSALMAVSASAEGAAAPAPAPPRPPVAPRAPKAAAGAKPPTLLAATTAVAAAAGVEHAVPEVQESQKEQADGGWFPCMLPSWVPLTWGWAGHACLLHGRFL